MRPAVSWCREAPGQPGACAGFTLYGSCARTATGTKITNGRNGRVSDERRVQGVADLVRDHRGAGRAVGASPSPRGEHHVNGRERCIEPRNARERRKAMPAQAEAAEAKRNLFRIADELSDGAVD
jgi:phage terminase small subunit